MYATEQDIIERYGQDALYSVFDRDGNEMLDAGAVERALADATETINIYVARRHQLPLATIPQVLVRICVDIAMYIGASETVQTEDKRQRYDDAIALLKSVAKGDVSLGLDEPASGGSGGASFSGNGRLFSRYGLRGM